MDGPHHKNPSPDTLTPRWNIAPFVNETVTIDDGGVPGGPFIDRARLARTFTRRYAEEADMGLSAIDCVLNGEKGVYASCELTTGRRVHGVLREIGARRSIDLRPRLGEQEYTTRIWNPNVAEATAFARRLHHTLGGNQLVITPAPFMAPGWSQDEFLSFWETLIRTRVKAVYFNDGWEFSTGCTFEFLVAWGVRLPTFDASGTPIDLATAMARLERAMTALHEDGLDADELRRNLAAMRQMGSASR